MQSTTGSTYYVGQSDVILDSWAQRTLENSGAYFLNFLTPAMKILDVGCGPGSITIDLAKRVPQGHVTGLDTPSAQSTIDRARADAAGQNVLNVEFVSGDALALPFADHAFDLTHAHQVLQHLTEPIQALREMRRVTKPGGIVACREAETLASIIYPPNDGISAAVDLFARFAVETSPPRDQKAGQKLHVWAREVGFRPEDVRTSSSTWTYRTPEERMLWAGPWIIFVTESEFAKQAVQKGYVTEEELKRMAGAWQRLAEEEDGLFVLPHVEMLARK